MENNKKGRVDRMIANKTGVVAFYYIILLSTSKKVAFSLLSMSQ